MRKERLGSACRSVAFGIGPKVNQMLCAGGSRRTAGMAFAFPSPLHEQHLILGFQPILGQELFLHGPVFPEPRSEQKLHISGRLAAERRHSCSISFRLDVQHSTHEPGPEELQIVGTLEERHMVPVLSGC